MRGGVVENCVSKLIPGHSNNRFSPTPKPAVVNTKKKKELAMDTVMAIAMTNKLAMCQWKTTTSQAVLSLNGVEHAQHNVKL